MSSLGRCLFVCIRGLQLIIPLRAARSIVNLTSLFHTKNYTLDQYSPSKPFSVQTNTRTPSPPKTRAVIFDLGGVIVPSPQPIFDRFEEKHGLEQGSVVATIKSQGDRGAFAQMERGELSVEGFCEPFRKEYALHTGVQLTMEQVQEFMSELSDFTKLEPHEAVLDTILWLKSKDIKVAILTNNFKRDNGETVFPRQSLSGIDVVVESCVESLRKPDRAIFDLTLEKLGVSANEAVFLDDLGGNLKTARQMGMATIKVSEVQKALKELEQIVDKNSDIYHIPGTSEVNPKLQLPVEKLVKYLRENLGLSQEEPPVIRQFKHGQSNPTYYVSYGGAELVLRKKPPGKLLPSAHAVDREYRVMRAVKEAGVPIPPLLSLCEDDSVLGTPFYLMGYVSGRVLKDPSLTGIPPRERRVIYKRMPEILASIHSVDIEKADLLNFGKFGNYVQRQTQRWSKQYEASKTHDIHAMDKLISWLPDKAPTSDHTTIVHGDFRLDNLIFAADRPEVLAVLDWELSTLGDPLSDLAYCCLTYHLDSNQPHLKGLSDLDIADLGLPSEGEIISRYCELTGRTDVERNWDFYLAFTFFRVAAILQGVYKRSLQNQASSDNAKTVGLMAEKFAQRGWYFAQKQDNKSLNPSGTRSYSTYGSNPSISLITGDTFHFPPRLQTLRKEVLEFVHEEVFPLEEELLEHQRSPDRWIPHKKMENLKVIAWGRGLWNLFLPVETDVEQQHGAGLTNLEYAHLAEIMGWSLFGSEPFNCSPPDTGNMEVLVKYGSDEQKKTWLKPLLAGEIRSCFGMTEPAVASSDASNIQSSIQREGSDSYLLNGRKWWISGAMDPRCKVCIFMGKTDPTAAKHKQQSMVLVPMDTEGVNVLRPLTVFGYDDAPSGHAEIDFSNVRVPAENLILGEGRGFEIAQGRLGPGRIHHCMRLIGMAERSLQLMKERVKERVAFGKPLAERDTILADIAHSRMEIDQARLLTVRAAHLMDTEGNKAARQQIGMIKVVAPNMALRVIDRAMQAHGAMGLSSDRPLAQYETTTEPVVFPAAFPNLLVNGGTGIAVGMATNIPSHNLGEVIDGVCAKIDNPNISIEEMKQHIKGPDFASACEIRGFKGIDSYFRTGRGSIRMRGVMEVEEKSSGAAIITIRKVPHGVNRATLQIRIAELVREKILTDISGMRDLSDEETRIEITLKRDARPQVVVNQLFKLTAMETSFGVNMLAILNRRPKQMSLLDGLDAFIEHRREVVIRRTRFLLQKAEDRAENLEAFLLALGHLDDFIRIIRQSKNRDEARAGLKAYTFSTATAEQLGVLIRSQPSVQGDRYIFTDRQVNAILELRLYQLTALEQDKVKGEYDKVIEEIKDLMDILDKEARVLAIIKEEVREVKEKWATPRRCPILPDEGEIAIEDLIANEGMIVTLSHRGYIKRTPASEFNVQGRGGKGVRGMETRSGDEEENDFVEHLFSTTAHDYLMFFTNTGRVYVERVYDIPEGSRASKGRSIKNVLNLQTEENIAAMLRLERRLDDDANDVTFAEDSGFVLFATQNGKVKKTGLWNFRNFRKDGIIAIKLDEGNDLIDVKLTTGSDHVVLVTRKGLSLRFSEEQARPMGRTAAGVRGIKPRGDDYLVGLSLVSDDSTMLVASQNGIGKRTPFGDYRSQTRGGKGIITMKVTEKTGDVVGAVAVEEADELMLMTTGGQSVRIRVAEVREAGRNTQGVKLVTLKDGEKLQDIARVVPDAEEADDGEDGEAVAPEATAPEGGEDASSESPEA